MNTAIWMLLAFASWTVLLLISTIGVYRWHRILTGKTQINGFSANPVEGAGWYLRAIRAHANCVENLPVFASIVLAIHITRLDTAASGTLCMAVVMARVLQSLVHICLQQTSRVAALRFALFFSQLVCFVSLTALIVAHAVATP